MIAGTGRVAADLVGRKRLLNRVTALVAEAVAGADGATVRTVGHLAALVSDWPGSTAAPAADGAPADVVLIVDAVTQLPIAPARAVLDSAVAGLRPGGTLLVVEPVVVGADVDPLGAHDLLALLGRLAMDVTDVRSLVGPDEARGPTWLAVSAVLATA